MGDVKSGISNKGKEMHYSVSAVIKKNGKYLLIDRAIPPYGFAGIAGHIDIGEEPEQALEREIKEESGLDLVSCSLISEEEIDGNWCNMGIKVHHHYLFQCEVKGVFKENPREVKSIGWFTKEEIKKIKLEPVWKYFFEKLRIVQ
ncbi:MAG: NUDIX domain-containing protein [Candidatus Woesearchaeota archaeon]